MWSATTLVLALALLQGATGAAIDTSSSSSRLAHRRGHVARLQETVDRLRLKQMTDHILLENLQEAVLSLQENSRRASRLPEAVEAVEAEGRALAALGGRVAEVRGTFQEALQERQDEDEVGQLRQEVAYLRSEVQRLKTAHASSSTPTGAAAAHIQAQEQRDAVTSSWVVENVRRLQDAVVDLQQAVNVSQAMHDKMEVESRLLTVTKDVSALRGTMAALTSKAEAAMATSSALQQEVGRVTEEANKNAGHLGAMQTEVTSIRQDFNDLLSALPEGTMAGLAAKEEKTDKKDKNDPGHSDVTTPTHARGHAHGGRLAALERRADEFDFALTRVQKQVSSISSESSQCQTRLSEVESHSESRSRELSLEVSEAKGGVAEVRLSSVQLLASLEALEARLEKEVAEVKQEVAKVEFDAARSAADHKVKLDDARVALDDTTALRNDLEAAERRLDHLTLKTAGLEGVRLEAEVSEAECRSRQVALELRVTEVEEKVVVLEEEAEEGRGKRRRHMRERRKEGK